MERGGKGRGREAEEEKLRVPPPLPSYFDHLLQTFHTSLMSQ